MRQLPLTPKVSATKGTTAADDRRNRLLAAIRKSQSFFSLKELETQVAKSAGVPGIQVKQIVKELVDDNQVTCEKIGTGCYYWSFADSINNQLKARISTQQENISALELKVLELQKQLEEETELRDPSKLVSIYLILV